MTDRVLTPAEIQARLDSYMAGEPQDEALRVSHERLRAERDQAQQRESKALEMSDAASRALIRTAAKCERLTKERDLLRAALYPLVVGCLEAEAREDAPEFVNGEAQRGADALGACVACGGKGSTDGRDYVDEPIPEAVRRQAC